MNYSKFSYYDTRINKTESQLIRVENGAVTVNSMNSSSIAGVRVLKNGAMGFSFTNDLDNIDGAFDRASKIAGVYKKYSKDTFIAPYFGVKSKIGTNARINPFGISSEDKIKFLKEFDSILSKHPKVKNTNIASVFSNDKNNFSNSEGASIAQEFVHSRFYASATMKDGDKMQQYFISLGKHEGWEFFESMDINSICTEILEKCEKLLYAEYIPAGRFPVVIDPELGGVFFHEAVGHACEADAVTEKASVLSGRIGEQIAEPVVTLYDDANVSNSIGSYYYDSEGIRARRTLLIDSGFLKSYIHSRQTAAEMNAKPTGNGRAMSAGELPIPRMSNIVLRKGSCKPEELFESIKYGIYVVGSKGGVVEPTKGHFLFSAKEAYLIKNGEITKPLKDASLSGNITETLKKISAVAEDSRTTFSGGYCGKKGQYVPVGETCSHIKVDEVTVGGRTD